MANDGYIYQSIGTESLAPSGLTVKVNDIQLVEKSASIQLVVSYTQKNNSPSTKIDEGSFKLFFTDGSSQPQYGFFNSFFPGDGNTRSYTWEWLKGKEPWLIQWESGFFDARPTSSGLKWKIGTSYPSPGQSSSPVETPTTTPLPISTPTPTPSASVPEVVTTAPSRAPGFAFFWKGQTVTISAKGLGYDQDSLSVSLGGRTIVNKVTRGSSFYKTSVAGVKASNTASWSTQYFEGQENFVLKYSSCNNLWRTYDGGISRSPSVKNNGSNPKKAPTLFPSLYNKNVSLDKDSDGLICER